MSHERFSHKPPYRASLSYPECALALLSDPAKRALYLQALRGQQGAPLASETGAASRNGGSPQATPGARKIGESGEVIFTPLPDAVRLPARPKGLQSARATTATLAERVERQDSNGRRTSLLAGVFVASFAVTIVILYALLSRYLWPSPSAGELARSVPGPADVLPANDSPPAPPPPPPIPDETIGERGPDQAEEQASVSPPGFNPTGGIDASSPTRRGSKAMGGINGEARDRSRDPADLVNRIEAAVVRIETDRGVGSGFVVHRDGLAITNFHVVTGTHHATAAFNDGRTMPVLGWVAVDQGRDLVLLRLSTADELPTLSLSPELPRKLEPVAAFGCPEGFSFSTTRGEVSAIRPGSEVRDNFLKMKSVDLHSRGVEYSFDAKWVQTTAPISPGNSGGPLVDSRGLVVGASTWGDSEGRNLNFAIASVEILTFLSSAGNVTHDYATLLRQSKEITPSKGTHLVSGRDEVPDVVLPSGKTINDRMFAFDADDFMQWIQRNYAKSDSVVALRRPNGSLFAFADHKQGVLEGITFATYDNRAPMVHANYRDGRRHGILRTWDEDGRRVYWCEYSRGRRNGLCCYFDRGSLRLVLECVFDEVKAVHLIDVGQVAKSFQKLAAAEADQTTGALLADLTRIETQMDENERQFKKVVKAEDLAIRQKRVSILSPLRQAAMQQRINQRASDRDALIQGLQRKAGL